MVMTCSVKSCKNKAGPEAKANNRTFHAFPSNSLTCSKWYANIGTNNIGKSARLCSEHFSPECFQQTPKRKKLFPYAVPSLKVVEAPPFAYDGGSNLFPDQDIHMVASSSDDEMANSNTVKMLEDGGGNVVFMQYADERGDTAINPKHK